MLFPAAAIRETVTPELPPPAIRKWEVSFSIRESLAPESSLDHTELAVPPELTSFDAAQAPSSRGHVETG